MGGLFAKDKIGPAIRGASNIAKRAVIVARAVESGLAFLQAYVGGDPDDAANQDLGQEADIDHVQHVGFENFPVPGDDTEGIVIETNAAEACIAERRALPSGLAALVAGEARTYGEDGQSVLHKTGGDVEIEPKAARLVKIGAGAVKAIAINKDSCPHGTAMATWMGQVETVCNGVAPGAVVPLSTVFGPTEIATITASTTKGVAE